MKLIEELEQLVQKEEDVIKNFDFAGGGNYKILVKKLRELLNKYNQETTK